MVSTPLKNISQNGNLPQVGVKIKIFETTNQLSFTTILGDSARVAALPGGLGWNFGWEKKTMRTRILTQIHPCLTSYTVYWQKFIRISTWVFPKIVGFPPKSSILIGFSIIFTIHFGGPTPILGNPHIYFKPKTMSKQLIMDDRIANPIACCT